MNFLHLHDPKQVERTFQPQTSLDRHGNFLISAPELKSHSGFKNVFTNFLLKNLKSGNTASKKQNGSFTINLVKFTFANCK